MVAACWEFSYDFEFVKKYTFFSSNVCTFKPNKDVGGKWQHLLVICSLQGVPE